MDGGGVPGAPPYQVHVRPLRLNKTTFAGTPTVFFAFGNAVKLVPYQALGQLSPDNLRIDAVLALSDMLAVLAGYGWSGCCLRRCSSGR